MFNSIRTIVSENRKRWIQDNVNLDLAYITNRIIAMSYPSEGLESLYRNSFIQVKKFLTLKHAGHYKVYNLRSEKLYELTKFEQAANYPFLDHQAPPFDTLVEFCKDASSWLKEDEENVVAIHCKAGKGRTGTVIAALLLHLGLALDAKQAIQLYGTERTHNEKGITIPSQIRYVYYYDFMLKNTELYKTHKNKTLKITQITIQDLPQNLKLDEIFKIKVFQNHDHCVYDKSSNEMKMDRTMDMILIHTLDIPIIKQDFKIALYNANQKLMCSFWLNSAFVYLMNENVVHLTKQDMDRAFKDTTSKEVPQHFNIGITCISE